MTERTWTIQMMWDCSHCGTRNPGMTGEERESLKCSHCGAEKTTEEWVMPDAPHTAPHLTGDLDRLARAGENRTCPFCKAESRVTHLSCDVCGADYPPSGDPVPAEVHSREEPESSPVSAPPPVIQTASIEVSPYRYSDLQEPDFEPIRPSFDSGLVFKGIVGVGMAVLFVWLMVWLFTPNTTVARVDTMTWTRARVLQERHSYNGQGWRSQAPAGVYSWDHCETRQRGTENCHPHECNCRNVSYECNCRGGDSYDCNCRNNCSTSCTSNRNGSATCRERCSRSCSTCRTPRVCSTCFRRECSTCYDQCPVYAEWCSYRYYQWDQINQARTAGNGHGAVWPILDATGPYQRVESSEEYRVRFTDTRSERDWVRTYSFDAYERFNVGQRWNIEWTRAGGLTLVGLIR